MGQDYNWPWPYFDPEYEFLSQRWNPPGVSVDNDAFSDCTVIKVDNVNKPGILREVVQVLTDLDLSISKAYISSDGGWFMDVFHVTDQNGNKIADREAIEYIEKAFGPKSKVLFTGGSAWLEKKVGVHSFDSHTVIELIGTDRQGLLSEISAVLTNLHCNVVAAEVWTHKMRVACVVYVTDVTTYGAIDDPDRLSALEEQLTHVMRGRGDDWKGARTKVYVGFTHIDRRLHQMMLADRDFDSVGLFEMDGVTSSRPNITIDYCWEKDYSVVNVQCKDRSKLLFDIVCTLTDLLYVVFHASIGSEGPYAVQEYYIRHMDGRTMATEGEKERVIKCLQAAIQRRVTEFDRTRFYQDQFRLFQSLVIEGLGLEICARDRVGLLSEVTRVFREYGLSVTRAGVTTVEDQAMNIFYVRDASGNPVDMKTIEELRRAVGHTIVLDVKKTPTSCVEAPKSSRWAKANFFCASFFERFFS